MFDHTTNPVIFYKNITPNLEPILLVYDNIMPYYMIYPTGEIYSRLKNKYLQFDINKSGYFRICLITNNGKRNFSVHRLVANSFIINPFPDTYTDVNHIDGNKQNNNYLNLEWCNNNQNKYHASINELYQHGEDRYNSVYSDNLAIEICEKFQKGIPYIDVYKSYVNKYDNNSSTLGSFIYKLYHRKTRNHITKKFIY